MKQTGAFAGTEKRSSFFTKLSDMINSNDPHSAIDDTAGVRDIHDNAEVFETRTENVFRYMQVSPQN
jgi:hypothetical protein